MPKPLLVHCASGFTSAIAVTLLMGKEVGAGPSDVMQWGMDLGFNYANLPHVYNLVNTYLSTGS